MLLKLQLIGFVHVKCY